MTMFSTEVVRRRMARLQAALMLAIAFWIVIVGAAAIGWISRPIVVALIASMGMWVVAVIAYHDVSYRRLRRAVAQSGLLICKHCGYDLRGCEEKWCPECGKVFDAAELRQYWKDEFWRNRPVPPP